MDATVKKLKKVVPIRKDSVQEIIDDVMSYKPKQVFVMAVWEEDGVEISRGFWTSHDHFRALGMLEALKMELKIEAHDLI
jgi:hypothetical protein